MSDARLSTLLPSPSGGAVPCERPVAWRWVGYPKGRDMSDREWTDGEAGGWVMFAGALGWLFGIAGGVLIGAAL
jgi:hypothetical protein